MSCSSSADDLAAGEGGFTIVEMMVALSMLAVAMVAISGVFFTGLKAASASATRSSGVALATRETEAIRAVPYAQIGFYDDQADRVSAFESLDTVSLGASTPAAVTPRLQPTGSAVVGPVTYSIRRHLSWVDATGPTSATDPTPITYEKAYKKSVVIVTWTDGSGPHAIRQDSIVYPGGLGAYAGPASVATTTTTAALSAPTAPTLTSVTAPDPSVAHTQLDVTWSAPSAGGAVTHYIVQWSTDSSFTAGVVSSPQQPPSATSYQASGLASSTTYHFRVIAYAGAALPSPASSSLTGTTTAVTSASTCVVTGLNVSGTGTAANQGLSTKTYLRNGNNRLEESFNLVVTTSGTCSGTYSVRGVNPSGADDPGSRYTVTGAATGTATGTIAATGNDSWAVGVHTFTVYSGTTAVTPAIQKTFLFCAATTNKSSNPNQC